MKKSSDFKKVLQLDESTRKKYFRDAEPDLDLLRAGKLPSESDDFTGKRPTRDMTPPHIKNLTPPLKYCYLSESISLQYYVGFFPGVSF